MIINQNLATYNLDSYRIRCSSRFWSLLFTETSHGGLFTLGSIIPESITLCRKGDQECSEHQISQQARICVLRSRCR